MSKVICDRFDRVIDGNSKSPMWLITSVAKGLGMKCQNEFALDEYRHHMNTYLYLDEMTLHNDGTITVPDNWNKLKTYGAAWVVERILRADQEIDRKIVVNRNSIRDGGRLDWDTVAADLLSGRQWKK